MKRNQGVQTHKDQERPSFYVPANFFMLRSPTLSIDTYRSIVAGANNLAENAGDDEELDAFLASAVQQTDDILRALVIRPEVAQALMIASTSLTDSLIRLQQSSVSSRNQARVFASVLRYIVRMCTRPTPFGLFAGVSIGNLADETTAQLAFPAVDRIRTQADMKWLLEIVKNVERDLHFVQYLNLAVNQAVYIIGSRAIVPFTDADSKGNTRAITLQITPVVKYILEMARQFIPYKDVRRNLLHTFPHLQEQRLDQTLQQLLKHYFLFSDLRPPLLEKDPLQYVLERLRNIPGTQAVLRALSTFVTAAQAVDTQGFGGPVAFIRQVVQPPEEFHWSATQSCYIDSTLDLEKPLLNRAIGDCAAQAAEILLRIAPAASSSPLADYHKEFVERYGMDAEISLLTLLSPEIGIGPPSAYSPPADVHSKPMLASPQKQQRDLILTTLLAEALNEGAREIELQEAILDQLAQCSSALHDLPRAALEMYLQVHAHSRAALNNGDWRIVIMSPPTLLPGGRTFGRFYDLLEEGPLVLLKDYARREEELFPDVVFAELSYLFCLGHDMNVMLRPRLHTYEIAVNTTPSVEPDKVIRLDDLVVGVRSDRFYLRSLRMGKEVRVCQSHALNTERAPALCRFLLDISWNGYPGIPGFDWGCVRLSPFLPRVVYQKVVLAPAQWRLRASDVVRRGSEHEDSDWFRSVQCWRQRWRVPRYVYLVEGDSRFLLDLEHPYFLRELRRALRKQATDEDIILQEMLPDFEHLWLRDTHNAPYISELVIPLMPRQSAAIAENKQATGAQSKYCHRIVRQQERQQLPGGEWTSLKLYTAIKRQNDIIAGPMRDFVRSIQEQGLIDSWFFVRYVDPDPHLRIRFHASAPQCQDQLLITALAWGRTLVQDALVKRIGVDEYSREVERYGGPLALDAIERVFCASSHIASDILALYSTRQLTCDPIVTAVLSLDLFFETWGLTLEERLYRIQYWVEKDAYKDLFRPLRKLLCEFLAPWDTDDAIEVNRQRELLRNVANAQARTIRATARCIYELATSGDLWQSEDYILSSLAHMHLNRLQEMSQEQEKKAYACWKYTLESILSRQAADDRIVKN